MEFVFLSYVVMKTIILLDGKYILVAFIGAFSHWPRKWGPGGVGLFYGVIDQHWDYRSYFLTYTF